MARKHERSSKKSRRIQPSSIWKWLRRIGLGLAIAIIAAALWFRLSPWPGAMIIRYVFTKNGTKTSQALNKHAPAGTTVIRNQQYQANSEDTRVDIYLPENVAGKLPVIIWTHGGAWLSGSKDDSSAYFKLLAKAGFTVFAPNYSLAPDHKYPEAIFQLNAMHGYLLANAERFHADTSRITLAGDSAGSQLSAQLAALITNPAYAKEVGITPNLKPEQLKGIVLTCGIYKMRDLATPDPTLPKVVGWGDDVAVWAYSGTQDFSGPIIRQMSPYYHITKDFPPTFITGGNDDPLTNVQSKPFANELERLGVPLTRLFYDANHTPPLPHEYQFNLDNADGRQALANIVTFLHRYTY